MRMLVLLTSMIFAAGTARAADEGCRYSAERNVETPTDGIKRIVIHAGAGELNIAGEAGRRGLQIDGLACAPSEAALERIHVRVNRDGDALLLTTEIPEFTFSFASWFGSEPRLDLTIKLPAGMELDVEDSSGALEITQVGALRITDASGDLSISNIKGELTVADDSGHLAITQVEGPIRIADESGDISIADVMGEVTISSDGSGGIDVEGVQGSVTIGNDASGDIRIERVSGSVKIEEDGSGEIYLSAIKHDVAIDRDGSGEIIVENVEGDFTVGDAGSGGIRHERVRGNVQLASDE